MGVLLGSVAVVSASLVSETPAGNAPPVAPLVTAPQSAAQTPVVSEPPQDVAAVDATAEISDTPRVTTPENVTTPVIADTAPAALPDTGESVATLDAPDISTAPELVATAEEPVLPNPQSVAPQVPVAEDDLVVATAPAALPAPEVVVVDAPEIDVAPAPEAVAEETVADAAPELVTPEVEAQEPDVIAETATTGAVEDADNVVEDVIAEASDATTDTDATVPVVTEVAPETDTDTDADPAPDAVVAEAAPSTQQEPATEDVAAAETTPEPEVSAEVAPETEAETEAAPAIVAIAPDSSSSLPTGDGSVTIRRPSSDVEEVAITAEAAPAVDDTRPAIERYGIPASNPDNKPTVAVVLIDDGSFAGAVPALAGIPFPVTVVLNPSAPDAAEKMVAYRAAGIEVGVLVNLPQGATPTDVEVFFEAAFAALPETVAVLDVGGALASSSNSIIGQAITAVGDDGRGLVTVSRGLNTTLREAEKAGVPTGIVYRDLDSEGQDARVIRRFMDQAAFRARQESGVVLLGRIRADTISALILWGTANRAGQVALVPVTTVFNDG